MNKLNILLIIVIGIVSCSKEALDTNPTDQTTKEEVFSTVEGAFSAINGIYRALYMADDWSTNYGAENFGQASVNLASESMGDDFVLREPGSAWFWYDYRYWVRTEINSTSDRPFVWWNMYYKVINNTNNILKYIDAVTGDTTDRNNVKAQAYAMRAYAYFYLIQFYQKTYIGHENAKGVPIYTEPTTKNSKGKGRGTVTEVYTQINSDLDNAIRLFERSTSQRHKSHIDLYVAYGIKSRVAMVQNKWSEASFCATEALKKTGLGLMSASDITGGFSSINSNEWMWGAEINEDQATGWYSFFNHMDASAGGHAEDCRKCISKWLYQQIGANDVRIKWFNPQLADEASLGPNVSYNQLKFRVKSAGSWASDYIYMRAAEMYLNKAEAECRLGNYQVARDLLTTLIIYKDPDYSTRLNAIINGNILNLKSTGSIVNLLDEIILQRRIELWGEGFRILDIMRLKTGFSRNYTGSNHPVKLEITNPEAWDWIMMLPQKEFDGNPQLNPLTDQNPDE
jgi:starch-binding outer membrane protein, SusD/RagB family